jgi:hypothetical protein
VSRAVAVTGVVLITAVTGMALLVTASGDSTSDAVPVPAAAPRAQLVAEESFAAHARGWSAAPAALRRLRAPEAPRRGAILRALQTRPSGTLTVRAGRADLRPRTVAGRHYGAVVRVRAANRASHGRPARLVVTEGAPGAGRPIRRMSAPLRLNQRFRPLVVPRIPARGGTLRVQITVPGIRRGEGIDLDALTIVRRPAGDAERPAEVLPYDRRALFNRPIGRAPTHPGSAPIVAELARMVSTKRVNASVDGEVPPVYVARRSDPFYAVEVEGRTERFRVPRGAVAGSGFDHPLVILDPSHPDHGRHVELRVWQARVDHDARRIAGNGAGLFHYNNDGLRLNPDASPSRSLPFAGWGTGSGLSYLAGLVRPGQVAAGRIEHAVRVSWGCQGFTDAFVAPAVRTDQGAARCGGRRVAPRAKVDMGMRLRLDPSVNCRARRAPLLPGRAESMRETRFLRILCRALQDYGMVVLDGTEPDGLLVYMEHRASADWARVAGSPHAGGYGYLLRDGTTPPDGLVRDSSHGIPWAAMRVVSAP